jgi:methyltransferase (TIGR00027 family)
VIEAARKPARLPGVALTSLWVAAARARETEREDALFRDPFARRLAGDEGQAAFELARAHNPHDVPSIEIRTRWLDDRIGEAMDKGLRQVVILAAGMDARAYRLRWPDGTTVYELDRDFVLAYKAERLGVEMPACKRVAVGVDLRDDWVAALDGAGFDARAPTVFLVEGLLVYLPEAAVRGLIDRITSRAASGSTVLCDIVGQSLLESPVMTPTVEIMKKIDAPWVFGTDEPELLFGSPWNVTASSLADVGVELRRWPFPTAPRGTPGVPQSFLVLAVS